MEETVAEVLNEFFTKSSAGLKFNQFSELFSLCRAAEKLHKYFKTLASSETMCPSWRVGHADGFHFLRNSNSLFLKWTIWKHDDV